MRATCSVGSSVQNLNLTDARSSPHGICTIWAPRPGHERNLLSPPWGDLPVGRVVDKRVNRRVYPLLQKYFASPVGQIISTNLRHPTPQEGRVMAVAKRGVGCGGRGSVERAMDRRAGS